MSARKITTIMTTFSTVAPSMKRIVLAFLFIGCTPVLLFEENTDHQQDTTDDDARVGHIERRPPFEPEQTVKLHVEEVYHPCGAKDPVDHVSDSPGDDAGDRPPLESG